MHNIINSRRQKVVADLKDPLHSLGAWLINLCYFVVWGINNVTLVFDSFPDSGVCGRGDGSGRRYNWKNSKEVIV